MFSRFHTKQQTVGGAIPCHSAPQGGTGFTLIELLVSVAIITVITSIVLVNHSRFSGSIFLGNLAYDVALSVREAQVFGLSVKEFEETFDLGYGVHFDIALPSSFFIFADINRNQRYDGIGSTDQIVERFTITRNNFFESLCVTPPGSGAAERCTNSDSGPISTVDIAFNRPEPDAVITADGGPIEHVQARIIVGSRTGETRAVLVESTGQISVEQ